MKHARLKNIAVCASGRGSNFTAIAQSIRAGRLKARLALLVCDTPGAPVVARAKELKVPWVLVERKNFPDRDAFEEKIVEYLQACRIDLVVLAGFMRIIGVHLLHAYPHAIINIHPALLPSFKGAHAIRDAFEYGAKVTGVTVHFVDRDVDHGPIIAQMPVEVQEKDTLASLEKKIHKVEHVLYPAAIQRVLSGCCRITGRKVLRAKTSSTLPYWHLA